jgi:hypothetical protein
MGGEGVNGGDESEGLWLMSFIYVQYIICIEWWNFYNFLSGVRRGLTEGGSGGYLTNVQCKAIWNCHNESFLYNEYVLIREKKS